jgi:hypothetical protein
MNRGLTGSLLRGGAFEIEREEFFDELVVGERGIQAVGGKDGFVEAPWAKSSQVECVVAHHARRSLGMRRFKPARGRLSNNDAR